MARQRVLIDTKWSTPAATARTFGLTSKKRRAISAAVKKFLETYNGGQLIAPRQHASRKARTSLRRHARVR